jgi:hypothetical protein
MKKREKTIILLKGKYAKKQKGRAVQIPRRQVRCEQLGKEMVCKSNTWRTYQI